MAATIYSQNPDLNLNVQANFKQNVNLGFCHDFSPSQSVGWQIDQHLVVFVSIGS